MRTFRFRTVCFWLAAMLVVPGFAPAQESTPILLMPMPSRVQAGEGHFVIDSSLSVDVRGSNDARVKRAVQRFLGRLSRQTGVTYGATPAATPNFRVSC